MSAGIATSSGALTSTALARVTRYTLLLTGLAAVSAHLATGSGALMLGVVLGGVTQAANLQALAWLGKRLVDAGRREAGQIAILFGMKIMALIGVVLLMLAWLPLDVVGFMLGVATLMPAALLATLLRSTGEQNTENPSEIQV